MWFIGQFKKGSWGFQQEGCPPRYTSKHEAECIKDVQEALRDLAVLVECREVAKGVELDNAFKALAKMDRI